MGAETQEHQGQREGKQQQMAAIPLFVREELEMGGREEGEERERTGREMKGGKSEDPEKEMTREKS